MRIRKRRDLGLAATFRELNSSGSGRKGDEGTPVM
jgi:hypothetical protein